MRDASAHGWRLRGRSHRRTRASARPRDGAASDGSQPLTALRCSCSSRSGFRVVFAVDNLPTDRPRPTPAHDGLGKGGSLRSFKVPQSSSPPAEALVYLSGPQKEECSLSLAGLPYSRPGKEGAAGRCCCAYISQRTVGGDAPPHHARFRQVHLHTVHASPTGRTIGMGARRAARARAPRARRLRLCVLARPAPPPASPSPGSPQLAPVRLPLPPSPLDMAPAAAACAVVAARRRPASAPGGAISDASSSSLSSPSPSWRPHRPPRPLGRLHRRHPRARAAQPGHRARRAHGDRRARAWWPSPRAAGQS